MAFRQTTFDPSVSQQYVRAGPGVAGLPQAQSTVDMGRMEEALARQLANQKIVDERRRREIEKLCGESDELKELQAKIKAAYLNKERSQQLTEKQYRQQVEIVSARNTKALKKLDLTMLSRLYRSKTPRST